ncbi:MAG: bifunctional 2-polyprenyl-6-hydroxyphenol methylase/3-demethylubiquinol 3-O-methyltransferase UbiG [Natronospirillum sp.]|uniref:bifunctional 2-polyprenyl-6-hydroxyphenol methylase/3-demethylubiquinol 3-O-methyltransferase UbiG n=1 Tax=Natronospirillum sp. TaxID=2812955 RepID=UPI0025EDE04A|nr:bifunctional 2-polyprenyl-6-hydroxyphenol methylase/3-demethylubiquinol 3-O-methyltransferase UbiG [Natronospirillum sp.]MCH8553185.1 bifunctional 2-polyprenyl-6-hydroxyphenol methylase/3-demethylubiquinol 3-O-methyltransferase UbiG [Natronospirillum sp.]
MTDKPDTGLQTSANVDADEISRFDRVADHWWDPEGDFRPLHDINPLRADYIEQRTGGVAGRRVLDVGCGGGLLAEAMAVRGADVLGIDMSAVAIQVAQGHAQQAGLDSVRYRQLPVEELEEDQFEVITCLEMLEHVPDPEAIIQQCAQRLQPGGHLILSTINRNLLSYTTAILGAEYLLRLIPRGTHDYGKLIRPSELADWCRKAGLALHDQRGIAYNPLLRTQRLTDSVSVNYLMHFTLEA